MGRSRKRNTGLPTRVYIKGASYYYINHRGRWIRLCRKNEGESAMYRALAAVKEERTVEPTMQTVFDRYRRTVLPRKAPSTEKMQARQLDQLEQVFGGMDAEGVRPHHIAEFHDLRGQTAPISANRELALLSHVMRLAIRMGKIPSGVNPCSTIERHKEKARDRYVDHEEYNAVWKRAPAHLRVLMDLAYLTGQRQADLVKLRRDQLKNDGIHFAQGKTGKRLIVGYSANMASVLEAAGKLTDKSSMYVVPKKDGAAYGSSGIQTAWQRLITECINDELLVERFTFQDIRAKAASDDDDGRLLGHMSDSMRKNVYRRRAEKFDPVW
ncbi:tyrosine-type recombinase/integrase [Salinisphaera orenii]|uniref:tyrosine-type recombinase/integrase n=1 Tax=Salinisphaera orenii TaxID=856731 RepID=UPI000DBE1136